jgi:cell division protein FtsL
LLAAQKSSNAYKYQEQEQYISSRQPKSNENKTVKLKPEARGIEKLKTILGVLICFGVAFCIIFRYAAITEASNKIDNYKKQLSQIKRVNEQLQVELDRSIDLKKVEEIARTKLGMKRPEKYQNVYVKLKRNDYAEVVDRQLEDNNQQGGFAIINRIINNVLEYLY